MRGGKFWVDPPKWGKTFARFKRQNKLIGAVQAKEPNANFKLFFDIDTVKGSNNAAQKAEIQKIVQLCDASVTKNWGIVQPKRICLKNPKAHKYHLYYPQVIIDNEMYASVRKNINKSIKYAAIDECAFKVALLRIEGFDKYDRQQRKWISNTSYDIYKPATNVINLNAWSADFYNQTMLLVGAQTVTKMNIGHETPLFSSFASTQTNNNNNDYSKPNNISKDYSKPNLNMSDPVTRMLINNEAQNAGVTNEQIAEQSKVTNWFQHNNAILCMIRAFPVASIKNSKESKFVRYIDLNKSIAGRRCVDANIVHKSNNSFLVHDKLACTLIKKCRKEACKHKFRVLYAAPQNGMNPNANDSLIDGTLDPESDSEDESMVNIKLTDTAIANKFLELRQGRWMTLSGKNTWYHNGICWNHDADNYLLKQEIRELQESYTSMAAAQFPDNPREYQNWILKCQNVFQGKRVDSIKDAIAEITYRQIEWNNSPFIWNCTNGIYRLNIPYDNDAAFGGSDPNEFICGHPRADWTFHVAAIEAARMKRIDTIVKQILPDTQVRKEVLTYLSLGLHGLNIKNIGLLIGEEGGNGKSWLIQMMSVVTGTKSHSYGTMVSASTFLTNKKGDRASTAALDGKRFVALDELSKDDILDGTLLKRLFGNLYFACRKFGKKDIDCVCIMTLIIVSNHILKFSEFDKALRDRLLIWFVFSRFVNNKNEVNEAEHIYLKDPNLATDEWQREHACAFFHYIVPYLQDWLRNQNFDWKVGSANAAKIYEKHQKIAQQVTQSKTITQRVTQFVSKYVTRAQATRGVTPAVTLTALVGRFLYSKFKIKDDKKIYIRQELLLVLREQYAKSFYERKRIQGLGQLRNVIIGYRIKSRAEAEKESISPTASSEDECNIDDDINDDELIALTDKLENNINNNNNDSDSDTIVYGRNIATATQTWIKKTLNGITSNNIDERTRTTILDKAVAMELKNIPKSKYLAAVPELLCKIGSLIDCWWDEAHNNKPTLATWQLQAPHSDEDSDLKIENNNGTNNQRQLWHLNIGHQTFIKKYIAQAMRTRKEFYMSKQFSAETNGEHLSAAIIKQLALQKNDYAKQIILRYVQGIYDQVLCELTNEMATNATNPPNGTTVNAGISTNGTNASNATIPAKSANGTKDEHEIKSENSNNNIVDDSDCGDDMDLDNINADNGDPQTNNILLKKQRSQCPIIDDEDIANLSDSLSQTSLTPKIRKKKYTVKGSVKRKSNKVYTAAKLEELKRKTLAKYGKKPNISKIILGKRDRNIEKSNNPLLEAPTKKQKLDN